MSHPRIGILRSAHSPQGLKESLFPPQLPWFPEWEYRLRIQNNNIIMSDDNVTDDNDGDNNNAKQFLEVMQYFLGKDKHYLHFI